MWSPEHVDGLMLHPYSEHICTTSGPDRQDEKYGKVLRQNCYWTRNWLIGESFQRVWIFPHGVDNETSPVSDIYFDSHCNHLCKLF